jgi:hypothetical protein
MRASAISLQVGDRVAYRRGFGWRALSSALGAALLCTSNIPAARASDDGAVVNCPDLSEATTAELEARARATLLTSELPATAAISCVGETIQVRVDAGVESVTLSLRAMPATLREEVLRALDRALADLGAHAPPASATPGPSTAAEEATPGVAPSPTDSSVPETPEPSEARPSPLTPSPPALQTELGALVLGESWGHGSALGGGLRVAVRWGSTWSLGVRLGALEALRLREATVIEGHAVFDVAFTAPGLAGLRFGVGAGPSLLFASPASGFAAPGSTLRSALRLEAQIGRPFRWHALELTPWVGARTFSADRGLRVAERSRLVLGGLHPQVGLALSLIH